LALHSQGRFAEAERLFEELLRLEPSHAPSLTMLGAIALQSRRTERGIALIGKALENDPKSPQAHFYLGNGRKDLGRLSEAIASFDKAIQLKPDFADAHYARGTTLYLMRRSEAAVASFDKAIALRPDFTIAHNNRGIALADLKRFRDAVGSFNKAIALRPDYAQAYGNRGVALNELGEFNQALESFDRAIALAPDFAEPFNNRGVSLNKLSRVDEALASFERAIALNPRNPQAFYNMGNALRESGRRVEAATALQRALALKPDYAEARLALCMAELPILYSDEEEITARRAAYRESLVSLCAEFDGERPSSDLAAAFGSSQPFLLAYQGLNDRELQSLYGSLACRIMAGGPRPASLRPPPRPGERIRVGIVSGFFRRHSNWKIPIKGWLSEIDRQKFQIFGYHTAAAPDDETARAAALCDRFVQGPLSLPAWREAIVKDALDVLIYPEVGMDPVSSPLAAQRLAKVQCNSWGHPETSGMPTLDYFLSSDLMEPPEAADHYSEALIRLPNLSIYYEPIEETPAAMNRSELGLRAGAVAFWCGQSLYKYLPQHDRAFADIAAAVGDCQFVFLKHPAGDSVTRQFQTRLEGAFAKRRLKAADHCLFLDRLPARQFLGAMGLCDVFLDSIGWSGCNSTLESLACNLPIVTMRGSLMRGRHSAAILQRMGIAETIAESVDDYVAIAARLGCDRDYRSAQASAIERSKSAVYRDRACISALEDFLDRAVRQASREA
jgi:predicted O-linked N-acetylglucosamine transferase (SPINDLY family)